MGFMTKAKMLRALQGWIGVVGLMALGNTVSCFIDHKYLADRLFTGAPSQVNGLTARLFGVWTLLAALLRMYCAVHLRNMQVYNMTLVSFLLALIFFVVETFIYKTTPLSPGVIAPLIISGVTTVWMIVGYSFLSDEKTSIKSKKDYNLEMKLRKPKMT